MGGDIVELTFKAEVIEEHNPLLEGFGKISSDELEEFIGRTVIVKLKTVD